MTRATQVATARAFHEHGFAVVRGLLSADALALARALVADLVGRHRDGDRAVLAESVSVAEASRRHPQRNPGVDVDVAAEHEPYIIGNLTGLDRRAVVLFADEPLWRLAAMLLACNPGDVVFHLSNVTRKPARTGPAIGWHRDAGNAYFSALDDRSLRLLIPLQRMSAANGGTGIVPDSHLLGADDADDAVDAAVSPEMEPGDVLALHARVLHGGRPNRSTEDRDVIVVQFGVTSSELRRTDEAEALQLCGHRDFVRRRAATAAGQDETISAIHADDAHVHAA